MNAAAHKQEMERVVRQAEARRASQFATVSASIEAAESAGLLVVDTDRREVRLLDASFLSGSACLSPAARAAMTLIREPVLRSMREDLGLSVYVEGHTDPVPVLTLMRACGVFENNTQLSTLRATNVREMLVGGEPASLRARMPVTGWGADRLLNMKTPTSPENRRVVLRWVYPSETRTVVP